jgi:hypothetical protein
VITKKEESAAYLKKTLEKQLDHFQKEKKLEMDELIYNSNKEIERVKGLLFVCLIFVFFFFFYFIFCLLIF